MNLNQISKIWRDNGLGPLTFGFDVGIASVGWAVLSESRIVDLGVRCFDAAEDHKKKIPLNTMRRAARVARNRIAQRTWRLKRLMRLMRDVGMVASAKPDKEIAQSPRSRCGPDTSPWALRSRALTERLSNVDWARVLYHLVKHRGFSLLRKTELDQDADAQIETTNRGAETPASIAPTKTNERDSLKHGLSFTNSALQALRPELKTIGNIFWQASQPVENLTVPMHTALAKLDSTMRNSLQSAIRNKGGSYSHAIYRADLRDELLVLFDAQRSFGNPFVDAPLPPNAVKLTEVQILNFKRAVPDIFFEQVLALFDQQHPPITEVQMHQLIGQCDFESGQPRAPRNSFSNERSTWLQKLNNLEVRISGKTRALTVQERNCALNLPFEVDEVKYKTLREQLVKHCQFSVNWREASFNMLTYRSKVASNASWVFVVRGDGKERNPLNKFGIGKETVTDRRNGATDVRRNGATNRCVKRHPEWVKQ